MAILFSHVTMESDYGIGEFFACGFPNDKDDLDAVMPMRIRWYHY